MKWIKTKDQRPSPGALIVKRWKSGVVWAGIATSSDKDFAFDEWIELPTTDTRLSRCLPCPTCGASKMIITETSYPGEQRVVCNFNNGGCGTATAPGESESEAIANWNRRPL